MRTLCASSLATEQPLGCRWRVGRGQAPPYPAERGPSGDSLAACVRRRRSATLSPSLARAPSGGSCSLGTADSLCSPSETAPPGSRRSATLADPHAPGGPDLPWPNRRFGFVMCLACLARVRAAARARGAGTHARAGTRARQCLTCPWRLFTRSLPSGRHGYLRPPFRGGSRWPLTCTDVLAPCVRPHARTREALLANANSHSLAQDRISQQGHARGCDLHR